MDKLLKASIQGLKTCGLSLVLAFVVQMAYSRNPDHSQAGNPAAPIILNVTGIAAQAGIFSIAQLEWNPFDPLTAGDFYIERLEPSGWNLNMKKIRYISGKTDYLLYDTISSPFCESASGYPFTIAYRVRFEADDGINNALSNQDSDFPFADITSPLDVLNDTVSVYYSAAGTLNGHPVIGWNPSPSNDVAGYIIRRNTVPPTIYADIDTVPAGVTYYIDTDVNACLNNYSYAITTVDKCERRSPGTYGIPNARQTISLTLPPINPCDRKAYLTWTAYYTMPGGLGGYKVFRMDNFSTAVEIFDTKNPLTLSYTDSYNFASGHLYTYYIRAYSPDGKYTSSSCQKNTTYTGQSLPDTVYIMQASVENDSYVKVDYFFKPKNTVKKLLLERRDVAGGNWFAVDSIAAPAGTGNFLNQYGSINDTTARVHSQSYTYQLAVVDSCNSKSIFSVNTATTIFLEQEFSANENKIFWNLYSSWLKGVDSYDIYREVDGIPAGLPVQTVAASVRSFAEPTSLFDAKSEVCYWVVARENTGNHLTFPINAFSKSNIRCITKDPTLFMPNAFNPEGSSNNRLRPVTTFVDSQAFKMVVFDRWGREVFETTDMLSGWDGRVNGQIVPPGLYSYLLTYKSFDGKDYTKRGTASVIR